MRSPSTPRFPLEQMSTVSYSLGEFEVLVSDAPNSLRDRLLGPPPSPRGHVACHLPRNDVPIPHCALDSKHISTRASNCLCDPNTGNGCPSWATCDAGGTGVPSLSGTLGRSMGC